RRLEVAILADRPPYGGPNVDLLSRAAVCAARELEVVTLLRRQTDLAIDLAAIDRRRFHPAIHFVKRIGVVIEVNAFDIAERDWIGAVRPRRAKVIGIEHHQRKRFPTACRAAG